MHERRRKRSSSSVLLILSGIDMLSASLVCSVVLFVVLVGGQAGDGATAGNGEFAAPALLDVFWPQGADGPTLDGHSPSTDSDSTVPISEPYYQFLGRSDMRSRSYVLGSASRHLSFTGIHRPFAFVFYPSSGAPVLILVGCVPAGERFTIVISSEVRFDGTCAATDTSPLPLPAHAHIRLRLANGQHPPPDWLIEQPASGTTVDPAVVTLHPRTDAPPEPLTENRIVQVIE